MSMRDGLNDDDRYCTANGSVAFEFISKLEKSKKKLSTTKFIPDLDADQTEVADRLITELDELVEGLRRSIFAKIDGEEWTRNYFNGYIDHENFTDEQHEKYDDLYPELSNNDYHTFFNDIRGFIKTMEIELQEVGIVLDKEDKPKSNDEPKLHRNEKLSPL